MAEEEIGKVTRFFAKIGVAGILIEKGSLKVGDTIRIQGHTSDVTETVQSMQILGKDVNEANPGDEIGVKLGDRVRPNDAVFKVTPDA